MASTTAVTTVPTHSNYSSAASPAAPRRNSDNLTESPTPRTETEAEQMVRAAENVLDRGWYLFGCPYKTKIGFRGSNGSLDALNNEHRAEALHRWTGGDPKKPANPAIRLDMSGLVVVDVDHGFGGLSDAEVIEKAASLGLPGTYTVRSGGAKGGAHFYYAGKRTVKECSFEFGKDAEYGAGLSGDIKYKGHVMAEGALHASGNRYRVINDVRVEPLPSFWASYSRPKKEKLTQEVVGRLSPFELDNLKRDGSQLTGEEWEALTEIYPEMAKFQSRVLRSPNRETIAYNVLVPIKRRQRFLTRQIARLKACSLPLSVIRLCVDVIAIQKCQDGLAYMRQRKAYWDAQVFGYGATLRDGEIDFPKGKSHVIRSKGSLQEMVAAIIGTFTETRLAKSVGFDRLEQGVTGFKRNDHNHQQAACRGRKMAGWAVSGRFWVKSHLKNKNTSNNA
jgi:hypothetical protein